MSYDKLVFFRACDTWPDHLVDIDEAKEGFGGLIQLQEEAEDVTADEFLENVDQDSVMEWVQHFGYSGPTIASNNPSHPLHNPEHPSDSLVKSMEEDYTVSFHKSMMLGREVYYFQHSRIEHVYIPAGWEPSLTDVEWKDDEEYTPIEGPRL